MCLEGKFQRAIVDAHLGFHRATIYFSCCFIKYCVSFTSQSFVWLYPGSGCPITYMFLIWQKERLSLRNFQWIPHLGILSANASILLSFDILAPT